MSWSWTKRADKYLPFCAKNKIKYLTAANEEDAIVQHGHYTMVSGGAVSFAAIGIAEMADANYAVISNNHSDDSSQATALHTSRTTTGLVLAGPSVGDEMDIVIVGKKAS